MSSDRRTERLRVDIPTLEPDPAFLGMLAHLSASSAPTAPPRTARSSGFRLVVATASVAAIAAATWAAGIPNGTEIPLSPADAPTQVDPTGNPSPGDVGTPHSDVSTPGSPLSPGLPGASRSATDPPGAGTTSSTAPGSAGEHATDPGTDDPDGPGSTGGHDRGNGKSKGKAKGHDKDKSRDESRGQGKGTGKGRDPNRPPPGKAKGAAADDGAAPANRAGGR